MDRVRAKVARGMITRLAVFSLIAAEWVASALAQESVPAPPLPSAGQPATEPPGTAAVGPDAAPVEPVEAPLAPAVEAILPADVQVVRIQGPEGVVVEVLGPETVPVPVGDGHGLGTYGMRVGVSYRLKLTGIPGRPEAEAYPTIELVGHLHRPEGIDPSKYPIRIQLTDEDFDDVLRSGRLITEVVYLEDPDQALPLYVPKDEIPVVTLSPAEDPVKVAAALGRPMAIVQIGNRAPMGHELSGEAIYPLADVPCPFSAPSGDQCPIVCGPVCGTPPPPGRPWMPRDEFLCDGGDRAHPASVGGTGGFRGIDPRDAVVGFHADRSRPRVLPTNVVCVYAPRFACVRRPFGVSQSVAVDVLAGHELVQRTELRLDRQFPRRMTLNEAAQAFRVRDRASSVVNEQNTGIFSELRVLSGFEMVQHAHANIDVTGPEVRVDQTKAVGIQTNEPPLAIKTAEAVVVSGIVTGANEQVMAWKPQETVAVEEPPNKPGLAVIKLVDKPEAEPGDVLTYTIRFRNMGNAPIRAVSIVDSLLPRLEYVAHSAQGPKGAVFSSAPNTAGSTELRWDLPGELAPGAEGHVSFQAKVR